VTPDPSPLPDALLAAALRRDPAAPLITYYDDATGERVELSATTLANWVAKTANLLQDEFDVTTGSLVGVALPVHWQTAAVLLATWSCGATVLETAAEDDGALAGTSVVLTTEDRLAPLSEVVDADLLMGLSLHPLGMGMRDYTGPARDFAAEVRVHGDVFAPWSPPDPASPGLLAGGMTLTLADLGGAAATSGDGLGIRPGDRVLVDEHVAAEAGPACWLLAPLTAGASLVLCRNAAAESLARRAADERVTATLGLRIEGMRELGRPT
jgi:uncharacterized protein (TIGR03089 family)